MLYNGGIPHPQGYVHVSAAPQYDLLPACWGQGIITEAAAAILTALTAQGVPYVTATHDINNPKSGAVMQRLGMRYCYSYQEQWQPKNILVTFRLYQKNLALPNAPVYRKYWDRYPHHMIEEL